MSGFFTFIFLVWDCSLNCVAGIIANTRLLYFIYALVLAGELDLD